MMRTLNKRLLKNKIISLMLQECMVAHQRKMAQIIVDYLTDFIAKPSAFIQSNTSNLMKTQNGE